MRCPGRSIGHYPIPPVYLYRDTVQVATGRVLYTYTLGKVPIKKKKKKNTQIIICEIICSLDRLNLDYLIEVHSERIRKDHRTDHCRT